MRSTLLWAAGIAALLSLPALAHQAASGACDPAVAAVAAQSDRSRPGERAELFAVDGDVSKDFGAIRRVAWVMQGDRLMDGDARRAAAALSGIPK